MTVATAKTWLYTRYPDLNTGVSADDTALEAFISDAISSYSAYSSNDKLIGLKAGHEFVLSRPAKFTQYLVIKRDKTGNQELEFFDKTDGDNTETIFGSQFDKELESAKGGRRLLPFVI